MLTRRDKVLKLIVEYVVKNAQPVGSKTLIEEYGLDCSSATIRAEMNALENDGLLEKTHTSSGRVPSTKGYKYYVDNLREKNIDGEVRYRLQTVLTEKVKSIEEVIQESCEILSDLTNLASVVLGPNADEETLVSIQMIPLGDKTASAVFVTNKGYVENKTFVLKESIALKDVQRVVTLLNERLVGTPISELVTKMEAIKPLIADYILDNDFLYEVVMEAFIKFAQDRISLYGKQELLDQPEFANDAQKLKKLVQLLDHPNEIKEVVDNLDKDEDISVHFGKEEDDIAVVSAKVKVPGKGGGNIALVGPTRMDYEKVVATLEYVVKELENYFGSKEDK